MSKEDLEIPLGCDIAVSKEMYEAFREALIKKAVEKAIPVDAGVLGGMKIYVQPYIPNDTILVIGPDPEYPGVSTVVKIIKGIKIGGGNEKSAT